ncbi:hypothetical protein [Pseudoalteromonas 'SMAR']|uniref:hypothetical protein n=1 Tax=Pseudoalteromonas 'SMAR' TaxID=3416908 RepID=UPI003AF2BA74
MTQRFLKLSAITALLGLTLNAAQALEPKPDRAQVQNLYTTLLLPDGSYLNADISFDCGSKFVNTGIIITTDEGAQFMAKAYRALYGVKAGQSVLKAWNTKANPSDPRKPTMLLINTFPASQEKADSQHVRNSNKINKRLQESVQSVNIDRIEGNAELAPELIQLCGARVHENYK